VGPVAIVANAPPETTRPAEAGPETQAGRAYWPALTGTKALLPLARTSSMTTSPLL
jgi:hypothetical protein